MNTKKLALTIVFGALTVALNPSFTNIALYAPFAYGLVYQIWEIPIVTAFLIISPIAGVAISLLNTAVLLAVFPGVLPTGPFYNLAATLSMQAGIYAAHVLAKRVTKGKTENPASHFEPKWVAVSTAMGILSRVTFMSVILYFALPQQAPVGFALSVAGTIAYLPFAAIFNATLALYTIPIGYFIARTVSRNLRIDLS
jgi:riboflavin transporter FmnP